MYSNYDTTNRKRSNENAVRSTEAAGLSVQVPLWDILSDKGNSS